MSQVEIGPNAMFLSLTGYDEIGIAKVFGEDVTALRKRPFMFLRALVFAERKHAGLKDAEAHTFAMTLPVSDLNDYFADDPDEVDPAAPVTDAGKDSTPSA